MNWPVLAVGGGLAAFFAVGLLLLIREARLRGAAAANEAFAKRLAQAAEQEKRADAERAARMADAGAAVAVEPADRIRERMRKRNPATK
jgi:hypothetical protein